MVAVLMEIDVSTERHLVDVGEFSWIRIWIARRRVLWNEERS